MSKKFTFNETQVAQIFNSKYKYVARDEDDELWLFENKPIKYLVFWNNEEGEALNLTNLVGEVFPSITWEDNCYFELSEIAAYVDPEWDFLWN